MNIYHCQRKHTETKCIWKDALTSIFYYNKKPLCNCYNGQSLESCQYSDEHRSHRKSHSWLMGMQNGTATLEDSLSFSSKAKCIFPYGPVIWLDISLKWAEKLCPQRGYIWIFIAVLFITAETWKQPRCPQ